MTGDTVGDTLSQNKDVLSTATAGQSPSNGSGLGGAPDSTPKPVEKPTVLELHGYRVGKSVGQGSYAVVKEASSKKHNCRVAIKVISKRKAPDDYLEKFLPREIEVVKMLKHPNLVVFLQSIETNNRVYLVMEYVTGGDLLEVIRQQRVINEKQAGIWFGQLVDGIDYCHSKGIVHRDLKCENVLLDEFNNLKITDFGFARDGMAQKTDGSFPLSETFCGSYAYAPPEILTGTPYITQLADVWSMGVILYVMVVSRLPFDDSNHKKLLKQVSHGPTFPEKREVSPSCKDLILKILVKKCSRLTVAGIRAHPWFKNYSQPIVDLTAKYEECHAELPSAKKSSNTNKKIAPGSQTNASSQKQQASKRSSASDNQLKSKA